MNFRVESKPHSLKARITEAYHQAEAKDDSLCVVCEELGSSYIEYGPLGEDVLVCSDHLQQSSDYGDSIPDTSDF